MKPRNTLILALIVAALGAYLYLVERPAVEQESAKKTLLSFDRDAVSAVELAYPDSTIKLERSNGTWRITAPIDTEADQSVVQNLIGALADAELKKTIAEQPESLAPFGLDAPAVTVSITLADGSPGSRIAVGKTTPVGASAYARRGDDPAVLLTTAAFHTGVRRELKDLRDKTVLAFQDDAVQEIRIAREGEPEIVLRKEGDGWLLTEPTEAKADAAQVRSYLSALRSLRAQGFVDASPPPALAELGLEPARLSVTLLLGTDRAEKQLRIGAPGADGTKKEVHAQRGAGGPIFTVGEYVLTTLGKTAADLRDKTVLAFDSGKLASVVVTGDDGASFTLEKKDEHWTLADAGDAKVKEQIVGRFVDDLRTLKGTGIASEDGSGDFGLDAPTVKLDLRAADGSSLGTIRVARRGTGAQEKLYAASGAAPTVYTLAQYAFQRVDKRRSDFLEASPAATSGAADEPDEEELDEEEPGSED